MNSGVLLMRNTDWMRELFNQMARYGTHPMDYAMEEVRARPRCTTLHGCPGKTCVCHACNSKSEPRHVHANSLLLHTPLHLLPLLVPGPGDAGAMRAPPSLGTCVLRCTHLRGCIIDVRARHIEVGVSCCAAPAGKCNCVSPGETVGVCAALQHLRASLPSYEVGLYEQNVLCFVFYSGPAAARHGHVRREPPSGSTAGEPLCPTQLTARLAQTWSASRLSADNARSADAQVLDVAPQISAVDLTEGTGRVCTVCYVLKIDPAVEAQGDF